MSNLKGINYDHKNIRFFMSASRSFINWFFHWLICNLIKENNMVCNPKYWEWCDKYHPVKTKE